MDVGIFCECVLSLLVMPKLWIFVASAVVILSLSESLVRDFMLRAHANGYTKGGWVFMDVELFKVHFPD